MFFYTTGGSPYEIGVQTGQASALQIGSMLDYVTKNFRDWDMEKFNAVRKRHMAYTEKLWPELLEEVQGIADGSGFPFHLIYLMNFYSVMRAGNEGCTNVIFPTTSDGPLLAKTGDLPVKEGHRTGLRLLRPNDGSPAILGTTFPGTLWVGAAINEWGLAVGGSSCALEIPQPTEVFAPHMQGRYILSRAATVQEAIDLLEPLTIAKWGVNFALVDRTGAAAIVEKAGTMQSVRWSQGEPIFCTNHACTADLSPYCQLPPATLKESQDRFNMLQAFLQGKEQNAGVLRELLALTEQPGAISRYGDTDSIQYETEFCCILHPASQKTEFCFSHADRDPWREFVM